MGLWWLCGVSVVGDTWWWGAVCVGLWCLCDGCCVCVCMWVWACDVYNVYLVGEMCGAVYVGLWWLCGISVVGDVWWWVLCVCVCVFVVAVWLIWWGV